MKLREFVNLFTTDEQLIRLIDISNDYKILFQDKISKMPNNYDQRVIICIDTMEEDDFDGFLGVCIATKNEEDYLEDDDDND